MLCIDNKTNQEILQKVVHMYRILISLRDLRWVRRYVGRFARLAMIGCYYRCENGNGFSCGHSKNPFPFSQRNLGKEISYER